MPHKQNNIELQFVRPKPTLNVIKWIWKCTHAHTEVHIYLGSYGIPRIIALQNYNEALKEEDMCVYTDIP